MGEKNVKMRWIALLALVMLLLLGVGGACAEETAEATIDLVFDGKTYTDTVQVEWTKKYPVPEGGVKWDGTEEFIGYVDKDKWVVENLDGLSYGAGQIAFIAASDTSFYDVEQLAAKYRARIVAYLAMTEDYIIELIDDKSLTNVVNTVKQMKNERILIEDTITLNYAEMLTINRIPNDPWYEGVEWNEQPKGRNWNMEAIHASQAWDYIPFMEEERIGIIDAIFDENHEDIDFAYVQDANVATYNNNLGHKGSAHGTHVAGIALAKHDNGKGISGVFPRGKAVAIGILGENRTQNINWTIEIKEYILKSIVNGANVINMSMGWSYDEYLKGKEDTEEKNRVAEREYRKITEDSIVTFRNYKGEIDTYLFSSRIPSLNYFFDSFPRLQVEFGNKYNFDFVLVNSAGNDGIDAQYNYWTSAVSSMYLQDRLIIVGSSMLRDGGIAYYFEYDKSGKLIEHNWGERVDIVAPGWNVYSAIYDNGYEYENWSGTSMAAPHVAGTAAMMWSVNPELSGPEVKEMILGSSKLHLIDRRNIDYPMLDTYLATKAAFEKAKGNGILKVIAQNKATGNYVYDIQVRIKPLEICQETETTEANTGLVYPYLKMLKLGQYEVTISKDGYQSYTEKITVTRDSEININATLKPIDAPEVTKGKLNGMVTFNTQGVNDIKVNVLKGTTSVITLITANGYFDVDLEPGTYTLSIDADGYVPTSRDITVFTGKTTTENIELDDSMYAVATQTMNTSIQYDVKLFNAHDSITQLDMKVTLKNGTVLMDTANGIRSGVTMRADGFAFQIDDELAQGAQLEVTAADGQRRTYSGAIVLSSGLWSGTKKLPDSRSNGGYWDANGFYHESKY